MFVALLRRELLLQWRRRGEMLNPLFFFVMVMAMFPLAVTPEQSLLSTMAPGIIWVAALLAVLLSVDGLFRADHDSGALEQMLVAPVSLYLPVVAKLLAHWLCSGLPLALMSPVLGYMLFLDGDAINVTFKSLLLGTPVLTMVGAMGAALTVGLRNSGVLLTLLVLPLYVPVLVFGAGAIVYAQDGLPVTGVLALLGALLVGALSLTPLAIAAGLRISSGD